MSLYLVPQWLLPRTYDWVDPYRLVCVPTIASLRPLVYCFARASASARPSSRLEWPTSSWTGMGTTLSLERLKWELSSLLDDWNGNYPLFRTTGMGTILSSGRLEWELDSLPNDWNLTGNRQMRGVDFYPRLYL